MAAKKDRDGKKRKSPKKGKKKEEPAAKKDKKPRGVSRSRKKKEQPDLLDYRQMYALSKKERVAIYAILCERVASPKELSKELGEGLSQISYHVRVLRECEMIVEVSRTPRRGAIEHFYKSVSPTVIPPDSWSGLPAGALKSVSVSIMQEFFDDAREALEKDTFNEEPGELCLTPVVLDDVGIDDLGELSRNFIEGSLRIQKESTARQTKKGKVKWSGLTAATAFIATFISPRRPEESKKAPSSRRR